MQVFGDRHGALVHLFERECSAQRRHQKVIEESPCPALHAGAARPHRRRRGRRRRGPPATRTPARSSSCSKGDGDEARFYFLEINTRLQVEHPVTECVVGVDLVQAQLAVAGGAPLPWRQEDLAQRGHAIECRVYAEDPARGFLPQAGPLLRYREPSGPGVRVDAGVVEGGDVPVYYDPLLAKLIVWGATRAEAIARTRDALARYEILGVTTNLAFLQALIADEAFAAARIDTGYLDRELARLTAPRDVPPAAVGRGGLAGGQRRGRDRVDRRFGRRASAARPVRHDSGMAGMSRRYEVRHDDVTHVVETDGAGGFRIDGRTWRVERLDAGRVIVTGDDGRREVVALAGTAAAPWVFAAGQAWPLEVALEGARRSAVAGGEDMIAPMPATVVAIPAPPGTRVTAGDPVVVLEAMKMELVVRAPRDGEVAAVHCQVGQLVPPGTRLAELAP